MGYETEARMLYYQRFHRLSQTVSFIRTIKGVGVSKARESSNLSFSATQMEVIQTPKQ